MMILTLPYFFRSMNGPASDSITCWVNRLQEGDRAAVQKLWEAYFARLVELARARLRKLPGHLAD